MILFLCSAVLSLPTSLAGGQQVLVVDDDGGVGVDFTELQEAVDAASAGDVILVRSGTYSGLLLGDKSLFVIADRGADVRMITNIPGAGRIHIGDLAGKKVAVDVLRERIDALELPVEVEDGWTGFRRRNAHLPRNVDC